jgi:hypothetical protein
MKFLILYVAPTSALEEWAKVEESERKKQEEVMQQQWREWMAAHAEVVKETAGLGKTKQVSASGVADAKNGMMLYSFVEAESPEAAAAIFVGHPHCQIPGATIEVMPATPLTGM